MVVVSPSKKKLGYIVIRFLYIRLLNLDLNIDELTELTTYFALR
jgi:hypothetical protein